MEYFTNSCTGKKRDIKKKKIKNYFSTNILPQFVILFLYMTFPLLLKMDIIFGNI